MIIVGLQEVALASRGWKHQLQRALGTSFGYVGGESYAGMRVKAFSRIRNGKMLVPTVSAGMKVGAGFGDRWPNKGAVAIEIKFAPTCRVIFVVAHLAANEQNLSDREDDWKAIVRRLERDQFAGRVESRVVPLFHRYDHVFVLGDLNYRIVAPGDDKLQRVRWVQQKIIQADWESLVALDQLKPERDAFNVFANFEEHEIRFAPTFKLDPKTGRYSTSRVPSYCDRILWHSLPSRKDLVKCLKYQPLTQFRQSDHLPVHGEYDLRVPIVLPPLRPLRSPLGIRIVLELFLIRFVKLDKIGERKKSGSPLLIKRIAPPSAVMPAPILIEPHSPGAEFLEEDVLERQQVDEDTAVEESSSDSTSDEENDPAVCNGNIVRGDSEGEEARDCDTVSTPRTPRTPVGQGIGYNVQLLSSSDGALQASAGSQSGSTSTVTSQAMDAMDAMYYNFSTPSSMTTSDSSANLSNNHPRKRDSLQRQLVHNSTAKKKKRSRLNMMRMDVHGQGLFLDKQIYSVTLPKRINGQRERIGNSKRYTQAFLTIPFETFSSVTDVEYGHLLLELGKKKSTVAMSGVLPMKYILPFAGRQQCFELPLTKYGRSIGKVEVVMQLTVRQGTNWLDSRGRVIGGGRRTRRGKG